jgi:hypothetical protein
MDDSLNRRRNLWISLFATICSALIVYGVYVLQIKQANLQQTIMVVVPKEFIRANVVIKDSQLAYKPILKGSFHEDMITKTDEIVGKETSVPLGSDEPVLRWKINQFQLLPLKNQYTFQIPKDYILSISNGIRAGDNVRIYVSTVSGESYSLFDHVTKVASVKSSANVEVDSPDLSNMSSKIETNTEKMYTSRFEANGTIDQINLNLTEEEWLKIDKLCNTQTAKLVIAFSATSIQSESAN